MHLQKAIQEKIQEQLRPEYLEVINESPMHSVPPGSESHFKLIIVSQAFENQNRLPRHRMVHEILAQELAENIHALTLRLHTPQEWKALGCGVSASSKCRGGAGL